MEANRHGPPLQGCGKLQGMELGEANMNLPNAASRYGADMGRRDQHAEDRTAPIKLRLARVPLDSGGYDAGGAYWGHGRRVGGRMTDLLYCAWNEDAAVQFFLRADSREHAKEKVKAVYPAARFYR